MGVRDLWSVLEAVGQPVTLSDLQGKTLAIDLSIWIRESDVIAQHVAKPHLRNVFWKVYHLLRNHVTPVVVIEGTPPQLKHDELDRRQQAASGSTPSKGPGGVRSPAGRGNTPRRGDPRGPKGVQTPRGKNRLFEQQIQECCQLLDSLGVCHLQSEGEAEATCAQLNLHGVVDGCITQDGDAFLFGARIVYRNFTCNAQKVDQICSYRMSDVKRSLGLTRKHLVTLALLTGCDYDSGVKSVGKKIAMNFMDEIKGQDPIDKLKEMKTGDFYKKLSTYEHMAKGRHCTKCQHPGTKGVHVKEGCCECKSDSGCTENGMDHACPCDFHANKRELALHTATMRIRRHIMDDPQFPRQEVIDAFLEPAYSKPTCPLDWTKPSMKRLMAFNSVNLRWGTDKVEARVVPLFTAWDLSHPEETSLLPLRIVKIFYEGGQKLIEVEWKYEDESLKISRKDLVTTKEFYDGMRDVHPDLVSGYEAEMRRLKLERMKTPNKRKMEKAATMSRKLDVMFKQKKAHVEKTEPKKDLGQSPKESPQNGEVVSITHEPKTKTLRVNLFSKFEEISKKENSAQALDNDTLEVKAALPSFLGTHTVCEDSPASPDYIANDVIAANRSPIKIALNNESSIDLSDSENKVSYPVNAPEQSQSGRLTNGSGVRANAQSIQASGQQPKKYKGFEEEDLNLQLDSDSDSDSFQIDIPQEDSDAKSPAGKGKVDINELVADNTSTQSRRVLRSRKVRSAACAMDTNTTKVPPVSNQELSPSELTVDLSSQGKQSPVNNGSSEENIEKSDESIIKQSGNISVDCNDKEEGEPSLSHEAGSESGENQNSDQDTVQATGECDPDSEMKENNLALGTEECDTGKSSLTVDLTHEESDGDGTAVNQTTKAVVQNINTETSQSNVSTPQVEEQPKGPLRKLLSPKAKGKTRKKKGKAASLVGQPKISDVFRVKEQANTNSLKLVLVRNSNS